MNEKPTINPCEPLRGELMRWLREKRKEMNAARVQDAAGKPAQRQGKEARSNTAPG